MPNGQSRNYSYDDQGRLLQLANLHPTAGNLATYGYGYDLNNATGQFTRLGQRAAMTADVPSQGFSGALTSYNYDQNYQLTQASYPNAAPFNGEVDSWQYDAIGNRLANIVNGTPQNYTYFKNGSNPLNGQRLSNDGSNAYTYDANGSTLTKSGSQSYTFGWDLENRMNAIAGALTSSYTYDYRGRRAGKTVNGSTTSYLYQGLNLVQEQGGFPADYLFGKAIDEPLAVVRSGNVSYLDTDALGTVAVTNDGSGTIEHAVVFDAWGSTRGEVGTRVQPFTYTGRETGDVGNLFYRARYYNSGIGRFESEDPMGRGRLNSGGIELGGPRNPFEYANNNVIRYLDPKGLECSPSCPDCPKGLWFSKGVDLNVAAGAWGISTSLQEFSCLSSSMRCLAVVACGKFGGGVEASLSFNLGVVARAKCASELNGISIGIEGELYEGVGGGSYGAGGDAGGSFDGGVGFGIGLGGFAGGEACWAHVIQCRR